MEKSTHFFGTSVFGQLISLIESKLISDSTKSTNSDRYINKFTTKDHLISMVFCAFAKYSSLREVSGAMLGLSGKTKHFQLNHKKAMLTLNDRASGYGIIRKLESKNADVLADKTIQALSKFAGYAHTITSDNGLEFAKHEKIAKTLHTKYQGF